jgi:hypothetical protein
MTFLTPLAALAALAAAVPVAAWLLGRRRAESVRTTLGLPAAGRSSLLGPATAAAAVALLGLAAAQPALTHRAHLRERLHVQVLFVLDTSRSMAAARGPEAPTRLDRAVRAATQLRAAIADVPSGIATFTDRVLPDLLPVSDGASFDAVAQRAVAIESPPPADTGPRATSFANLDQIASGDYFATSATRRVVVLLTDGESNPTDAGALARSLHGYGLVAVRFWHADEAVYDADGRRETAYHPDPLGKVVLDETAKALGGSSYEEGDLGAATAALRRAVGTGPAESVGALTATRTPLAPWLAGLALLLLVTPVALRQKRDQAYHS